MSIDSDGANSNPALGIAEVSDRSILAQAASAVAEVVSSQSVGRKELGSQRQCPQLSCTTLWKAADGWIEVRPHGVGKWQ